MIRMYYLINIICCITFIANICRADESDSIYLDLEQFFNQIQNAKVVTVAITDDNIKKADPYRLLTSLEQYIKSENVGVKSLALDFTAKVVELHPSQEIRKEVVERLAVGLISKNEDDRQLRWKYRHLLSEFSQQDFSEVAKEVILKALQEDELNDDVILVCGIAQLKDPLNSLEKLLFDEVAYSNDPKMRHHPKWYYTLGWDARLARARMGVKEDIQRCVNLIEKEIDSNKNFRLLKDLGYIRQPESIESLRKYFLSNLALPPTNPGMEGEPYSKYLMPILEDNLPNFPIKKSKSHKLGRIYSREEIELCKKWMAKQSKWIIKR